MRGITCQSSTGVAKNQAGVDAAFIQFIRFANFGREPIRRGDIAPANPLRVRDLPALKFLTYLLSVPSVLFVRSLVEPRQPQPDGTSAACITFDFLDHHNGGMIRIVTADDEGWIKLTGDIIGMPREFEDGRDSPSSFPKCCRLSFSVCWLSLQLSSPYQFSIAGLLVGEITMGHGSSSRCIHAPGAYRRCSSANDLA